ncbi:tetratricopeptide repeat protein [Nocardia goodfellowii]|uniref:Tetratricopeptide (TPR) repeat protein/transcriptional regulator with XRE-family HTH domain n=1 Tax=Nocardia goodfellowii TaxID=882446 RepID=A0ABS4Q8B5_9NOCA|nr:tetratricopeptide repeat protein [Nocardia goodfellowii]MBP2187935.1 tetratricopeptide (TPR) repeat protein/transcriptional regulator with XRE-family HTH domain [Nocardia goodfellowii]
MRTDEQWWRSERFGAVERRWLRARLAALGLSDHELLEPMVAELRARGVRPRAAWRHAHDLTQGEVADRYRELPGETAAMKPSRISEFESWPYTRAARPTMDALKNLAIVYGTTWDQLVDIADLEFMPEKEKQEYRDAVARRAAIRSAVPLGGEIPAQAPHFTGREDMRTELHERVLRHLHGDSSAVHVIEGPPGVGKTALASYAVAAFARRYPDGPLWLDLRGHTDGWEPRDPADVLEQLLLEVGVTPEPIEADRAARAKRWRDAMKDRRMFIVFDNVLETEQARDLLPQAPGCFVLLTSRAKLTGLAGAAPMELKPMDWAEAEALLVRLANLRPGYDASAVQQILETSGRLPLAIKLIAGQIAHHGDDLLADTAREFANLTTELKAAEGDHIRSDAAVEQILGHFNAEGESLLAAFEVSYQRLRDPAQRRALQLLGWYPGPEISAEALAMMAAVPLAQAKALLRRLFEAGFLDPAETRGIGGPRYSLHDLTRLCARWHAQQDNPPSARTAMTERLISGNLATVRRMVAPDPPGPSTGTRHVRPLNSHASVETSQARDWLIAERENLLGCIEAAGSSSEVAELARLLAPALWSLGHWSDAHRLYGAALRAARFVGARRAEADALLELGRIDQLGGEYRKARDGFLLARDIAVQVGDPRCEADALCELGQTAWIIGDHDPARHFYTEALRIAREIGYRPTECDAHNGLGHVERLVCDYPAAREHFRVAWEIAAAVDDRGRSASVQWGHGEVVRRIGDYDTARRNYTDALRTARQISHPKIEGDALRGLGHIARLVGDREAARRYYNDSMEIALHIHDRYGEAWSLWGLGHVERSVAANEAARAYFEKAYDIAVDINLTLGQVDMLRGLGHIERYFANYAAARDFYTDSLTVAERIPDPHGKADALRGLGQVACETGRTAEARQRWVEALALYESIGVPLAERVREHLARLDG